VCEKSFAAGTQTPLESEFTALFKSIVSFGEGDGRVYTVEKCMLKVFIVLIVDVD